MDIVLVRHAIAVERSEHIEDAQRPLSERGVQRFTQAVRGLRRLGLRMDHVFHSPWLRAVQTAELLRPVVAGKLEPTSLLTDTPGEALLMLAANHSDGACIAFVGHEPWMGELLSLCLTGSTKYAGNVAFKKGGVAWLHGAPHSGRLVIKGMFTPRCLRLLGTFD